MNTPARLLFAALTIFTIMNSSCQKELFYEDSYGTLLDSSGVCRPSVVSGIYKKDSALGAGNTIDVSVEVTIPGSYRIYSDTVNGMFFEGTGYFDNTGNYTVRLSGSGMPMNSGIFVLTVKYCDSYCGVTINVLAPPGPTSQYILGGAPGNCTGVIIGPYTEGVPLNTSNIAVADVTVNQLGSYIIYTDTVNGVFFRAAGNFINPGSQTVDLFGSGTPLAPGTFTYQMRGGTSNCSFQLTFNPANPPNTDYFPLTQFSWWTYNSLLSTDTLYKFSNNVASYVGNTYRVFQIGSPGPFSANIIGEAPFRKSGNDYHIYFPVDSFSIAAFDNTVMGEMIFLKENAPVGTAWQSAEFQGQINSLPAKIRYDFEIQSVGGTHLVNTVNYNDVIKVFTTTRVDINNTGYTANAEMESYYARGIGLIEFKFRDAGNANWLEVQPLRYYKVF